MGFIQCQLSSSSLDMNVSVNVIYPEHVEKNTEVKVLYLLHGYFGHYMDWMRLTSIERYASKYNLCVVMPSADNSYYANTEIGANYFDYVSIELPKIIENMFHVSKKAEDRYVCGLSMGGYGALKIGLTYPDRYNKIASLSGAIEIDRLYKTHMDDPRQKRFLNSFGQMPVKGSKHDIYHLINKLDLTKKVPKLYLACGTEDFLYEDHLRFGAFLKNKHIDFVNKEEKGGHEWRLWDLFIQDVLIWMFEEK
ncbi:alpha/beta hydrolase [Mariniplasma anaerobium]|uniref:Esterase n=1 Tax=Mariniplasma anaerobium TaxID=2735436 RepID=A0A7U9TIJ1_9MOLU|nr:alpha/beta hydrolase family protein [Mariniplasma anaerobium]BCR36485.1 esterase [Mariniplasma anaerobium]